MAGKSQPKLGDMVPVDVHITDVSAVPAKYFLHDEVIEALHRVIRSDVVVHQNPVPPGAEAIFTSGAAAARGRMAVANSDLARTLKKQWSGLFVWWLFIAGGALIVALVWRWING